MYHAQFVSKLEKKNNNNNKSKGCHQNHKLHDGLGGTCMTNNCFSAIGIYTLKLTDFYLEEKNHILSMNLQRGLFGDILTSCLAASTCIMFIQFHVKCKWGFKICFLEI